MGLFDGVKAMAMMDDRLVQEIYKIIGELGWKQAGFKKEHRGIGSSEESWKMHFNSQYGLIEVRAKDDSDSVGVIQVTATAPGKGGKKKKKKKKKGGKMKLRVKDYINRKGSKLSVKNREMLKNEVKLFMQKTTSGMARPGYGAPGMAPGMPRQPGMPPQPGMAPGQMRCPKCGNPKLKYDKKKNRYKCKKCGFKGHPGQQMAPGMPPAGMPPAGMPPQPGMPPPAGMPPQQAMPPVDYPPLGPTPGAGPSNCPHCGAQVQPGWKACPACGQPVGSNCPSCGAKVEPGWKACPGCGGPL